MKHNDIYLQNGLLYSMHVPVALSVSVFRPNYEI